MNNFEKFEEQLLSKEKFYSLLTGKKNSDKEYDKEYEHVLKGCVCYIFASLFFKCKRFKSFKSSFRSQEI